MSQHGVTNEPTVGPYLDDRSPSTDADLDPAGDANVSQGEEDDGAQELLAEKLRREREARAQALTLEIVGDLPHAEVKPPENVLFICKLNPVTEGQASLTTIMHEDPLTHLLDEDLNLIFSRFGKIISCEVIRDQRTGDSLQYAFIEFDEKKDCEQAYFKMQGVLIDDHRIHVDFSQSVSRLSGPWRTATMSKRATGAGGFGGVANLEKKRQYRATGTIYETDNSRGLLVESRRDAIDHEAAALIKETITGSVDHHEGMTETAGIELGIHVGTIMVMIGGVFDLLSADFNEDTS
ncbi:MAG: hypothetical protein Q9219_002277 [cf. Caloplaca sp. 3 TL-2023]